MDALALALVAAGTTIGTVADIEPGLAARSLIAIVPIVLGLVAALLGFSRWQRIDDAIRLGRASRRPTASSASSRSRWPLIAVIAGAAAIVGVFAARPRELRREAARVPRAAPCGRARARRACPHRGDSAARRTSSP